MNQTENGRAASVVRGGAGESGGAVCRAYALAAFAVGAGYFIVTRLGSLWTTSIDMALHCVLAARLMSGEHFQAGDATMGEMAVYPRISHTMAAIVGRLTDSPVLGLHIVALLALTAIWGMIALAMTATRMAGALLSVFLIVMVFNGYVVHIEVFGNEIVGNYFFPQLVSQALAVLALLLAGSFERRGMPPEIGYFFLALCVPVLASVHLLPAVEVAGVLTLTVILDCWSDWRPRRAVLGGIAMLAMALLTVRNPDFWSMVLDSQNNGSLTIRHIPGTGGAVVLAVVTFAVSAAVLYRLVGREPAFGADRLFLKYVAAFGVSCSGLCVLQYLVLMLFGKGSEYAVKKYGFGLDTTLLLFAIYAIAAHLPKAWVRRFGHRALPLVCVALVPFLLAVLPQFRPGRATMDAARLVSVERLLRHYRDVALEPQPGKSDYAIAISGIRPVGDYLLSIAALHAPRLPNAYAIIAGQPLPRPDQVGTIFTSLGSRPWDVAACRRHRFPGAIVALDGACVFAALGPGPH